MQVRVMDVPRTAHAAAACLVQLEEYIAPFAEFSNAFSETAFARLF